jgi:hypothetical protein
VNNLPLKKMSDMLSVDHADISSFTTSGSAVFNNESRLTQDLPFKQRKKDVR